MSRQAGQGFSPWGQTSARGQEPDPKAARPPVTREPSNLVSRCGNGVAEGHYFPESLLTQKHNADPQ